MYFYRRGRIKGVLPVQVDMPTAGTEYRFEQSLGKNFIRNFLEVSHMSYKLPKRPLN